VRSRLRADLPRRRAAPRARLRRWPARRAGRQRLPWRSLPQPARAPQCDPPCAARSPKLIAVGPSAGAGMAAHVAFNPALISVTPTWDALPAEAGVGPVLQPEPVKIDPAPGRLVVTPPVAPGAFAADRAAVQAAARARAQPAP